MQYIDTDLPNIIEARDTHTEKLKSLIFSRATNSTYPLIKNFLTESRIEQILNTSPKKLYQLQLAFLRNIIPHFVYEDWLKFIVITKTRDFNVEETRLKGIFDAIYKEVNRIFDYDNFCEKKVKKYCAYNLAEKLDIPTCVYCNRIYTKTVVKKDKKKVIRPTFDHWYPKSKFPLLALSFYNLIPSCSVCNSGVKGSTPFSLSTHFHPYFKNPQKELKYTFSYDHKDYSKFTFKIITDDKDDFSKDSVDAFELEAIFKAHEDEIEDLRNIKDAYSEDYIEMLEKNILKGVKLDRDEVYRLAFGVHFQEAKFDRRPMSKMKKDILIELGIIKIR
ncbi:hypothetical protein [Chryseobacterium sp. IT-36CA2]|uniref:hypothetical protein n=1 Tax=Chryseobacterium sp. IT-36CA2 TaxID=3026460 RepID=UPI0039DF93F5